MSHAKLKEAIKAELVKEHPDWTAARIEEFAESAAVKETTKVNSNKDSKGRIIIAENVKLIIGAKINSNSVIEG